MSNEVDDLKEFVTWPEGSVMASLSYYNAENRAIHSVMAHRPVVKFEPHQKVFVRRHGLVLTGIVDMIGNPSFVTCGGSQIHVPIKDLKPYHELYLACAWEEIPS